MTKCDIRIRKHIAAAELLLGFYSYDDASVSVR